MSVFLQQYTISFISVENIHGRISQPANFLNRTYRLSIKPDKCESSTLQTKLSIKLATEFLLICKIFHINFSLLGMLVTFSHQLPLKICAIDNYQKKREIFMLQLLCKILLLIRNIKWQVTYFEICAEQHERAMRKMEIF